MKKYTANYAHTNSNFVIQNLVNNPIKGDLLSSLYVLKNLIQRGCPTVLSKYLQDKLGKIHTKDNFKERFVFSSTHSPVWYSTIKGDGINNYFPAKDFFDYIIPNEFGKFSFVQSLIIPEIRISEIVGIEDKEFVNQQLDFYLPQAKLVIEIDGQQHKTDDIVRISDKKRDTYLAKHGVKTIRITTNELKDGGYKEKILDIFLHFEKYKNLLNFYKSAHQKISQNSISEIEINTKLFPTAIIRFQILVIELLVNNYLTLDKNWNFNILCHESILLDEQEESCFKIAIDDLLIWIENLQKLKNKVGIELPNFQINLINNQNQFTHSLNSINVDFSLFKRFTDENFINPDIIFIRNDYFDDPKTKNYFQVSTYESINYKIVKEDEPILEFFLYNIFGKKNFIDGQFPIVSNALNLKDTIGLLPTGGGKSLCYQLPCLLQPSINFVVCPIKSLMEDQYENMVKKQEVLISNVSYINSDLPQEERRIRENDFANGKYLMIWISPEKFQIPKFREKINGIIVRHAISYAVIDEVHCLSEWGHDFRTSYLNLTKTIDNLSQKDENGDGKIKFIGLTATASVNVLKDIRIEFSRRKQRLEDENVKSLLNYSRKELHFEIINDLGNKKQKLKSLIKELVDNEGFTETKEKAGLIFTPNVNGEYGCYSLSNSLNIDYQNKVNWFAGDIPKEKILDIHGKEIGKKPIMSAEEFIKHRKDVQSNFKETINPLLVATKAFGMGIDKDNVHYTFHYGIPSSVESLYQEAGRAGRWQDKDKIAKCYVLYSPEVIDNEKVKLLFDKKTTFSEMKKIGNSTEGKGKDIFRNVYLFTSGQKDIDEDYALILEIIKHYFQVKSVVKIFWNDALIKLKVKEDSLQKAIYRLSLLGIVSDWTTDFVNHFEVNFETVEDSSLIENLTKYISKYEPDTNVEIEISKFKKGSTLNNSTWYLLNWIFENISYHRKESLKTLRDWCNDYIYNENFGNEEFKRNIDNYFKFDEITFLLQYISEKPEDFEKWFEAFYLPKTDKTIIYIPDLPIEERKKEFTNLKVRISRFIESYRNNLGLDFLSGFVRLALDEYEDSNGRIRLESTLEAICQKFSHEKQDEFMNNLMLLGHNLTENQQIELCQSISKFYPEKLEQFAEYYQLSYLLNDIYSEKLLTLKKINLKLYEQFATI